MFWRVIGNDQKSAHLPAPGYFFMVTFGHDLSTVIEEKIQQVARVHQRLARNGGSQNRRTNERAFACGAVVVRVRSMNGAPRKRNETWYRSLRSSLPRILMPRHARRQKREIPVPGWAKQPWFGAIAYRMAAAINQSLNLTYEEASPTVLGILCAQAENCSSMRIAPFLKETNAPCRARRASKHLWKFVTPMQEVLNKAARKIKQVMERQPFEVQIAFHNAHARAADKKMFQGHDPVFWETPATRLYLALMLLAPWMHQVKSVRHLHDLLFPRLGIIVGRDPKRLEKVCQRIGLKFRERGRPREVITPAA